ncbi:MAG: hypothetical protein ACE5KF_12610, partial [Kiloniellaceae bacterium]
MLDRVFAVIGMLAVIAFMGVVMVFVMEPDLWIVTITVLSIGILFFWREFKAGGSQSEPGSDSESD